MQEKEIALNAFLNDIECLGKLNKWTSRVNFFEIMRITNAEIRHSNFLAWLLDPSETHGLGEEVLKNILLNALNKIIEDSEKKDITISPDFIDYSDFTVLREWNNVDILISSNTNNLVICIENKIWSSESNNQLKRYKKKIFSEFEHYTKIFIYLTPEGVTASDSEIWCSFSYEIVIEIIEKILNAQGKIDAEVRILIQQYIYTVRRHIVGDSDLKKICEEIYSKHKIALDLIYENRPDNTYKVFEFIKEYMIERSKDKTSSIYSPEYSNITFIRFTTTALDKVMPKKPDTSGGWRNGNKYFYEIVNGQDKIHLQLAITPADVNKAEKLYNIYNSIPGTKNELKSNWIWKTVEVWPIISLHDKDLDNMYDEQITEFKKDVLNKIGEAINKISPFETMIIEKWNNV